MKKIIFFFAIMIVLIVLTLKQDFVPRFSYLYSFIYSENVENYKYITFSSRKSYEEYLIKYIEPLKSCYDESYFYDEKDNITYLRYDYI